MITAQRGELGQRRLAVVGRPGRVVTVTISLPSKARVDWVCRVRIAGAGLRITRRIQGIDGLQAVQLALEFARITLAGTGLTLTIDGGSPGDHELAWHGFSQVVPPLFGPDAQHCAERIDRCIQQQVGTALEAVEHRHAAGQARIRRGSPAR
jgi:hypothetical protein